MAEPLTIPEGEVYLTQQQLAERWPGTSVRTIEGWRRGEVNRGPPFVKIGMRAYYPFSFLLKWEAEHLCGPDLPPKGGGRKPRR